MSAYIAGFVCAIIIGALVIAFIAYYLFFKEKHKSERYQYDMSDIIAKRKALREEEDNIQGKEVPSKNKELMADRHKSEKYQYDISDIIATKKVLREGEDNIQGQEAFSKKKEPIAEQHESEKYQYDIRDMIAKRKGLHVEEIKIQGQKAPSKKKELLAGIIILPPRLKHHEDSGYASRPDYPESPANMQVKADKLIEIFSESKFEQSSHNISFQSESCTPYQSDV